jgi:hypothetical protein
MQTTNRMAKTGAAFYVLWGLVHVAGAAFQLITLRKSGGIGLTALISTGRGLDSGAVAVVPDAAAAFMGMGAMNILWIGLLVAYVGATRNWRNSREGYWLNLALVGCTDLALLLALLLPGFMNWSDGAIGLTLFALALLFTTLGLRVGGERRPSA